jgi:hypothetical protein
MQVKILQSIASMEFAYRPGQLVQISDDIAQKWQTIGVCSILPEVKPETIDEPKPKKTTKKTTAE